MRIDVLDHGYVELTHHMGTDETIIEAARMSTGRGFLGWGPFHARNCERVNEIGETRRVPLETLCTCTPELGDEKLLKYLWAKRHTTPFEQCEISFEVYAPIFVFREWHRHRTQSYNEFSARYSRMPNVHYIPTMERIKQVAEKNKQAQGTKSLGKDYEIESWLRSLKYYLDAIYAHYEIGLNCGIPKEIARILTPVNRYSKMRAKANLLNWLRFLGLRDADDAQYEIRMYAKAVARIIEKLYPRTYVLFKENPL